MLAMYMDASAVLEKRVEDLLARLTPEEKLSLMGGGNGCIQPIDRLGVPAVYMTDSPIGPKGGRRIDQGYSTAFPSEIAMAATWDADLIQEAGHALGRETANQGEGSGILLGPCVNIHRTPQGGRNFESFSEDPYLSSRMTVAYIRGVQSTGTAACVKHFACNNFDYRRYDTDVRLSERAFREIYLRSFEAAVKEAGVWSLMSAYNALRGYSCSENAYIQNEVLKKEWGFDGPVISDWGSVYRCVPAVLGGTNVDMPSGDQFSPENLGRALESGEITWEHMDDSVRRILRCVIRTGYLDGRDAARIESIDTPEHRKLARMIAAESMVLLKNEKSLLPFDPNSLGSIAVIQATGRSYLSGRGSGEAFSPHVVGWTEGISQRVGLQCRVRSISNDQLLVGEQTQGIAGEIARLADSSEFSLPDASGQGFLTEFYDDPDLSGEPVMTRIDSELSVDWGEHSPIGSAEFSVRWSTVFHPKKDGDHLFKVYVLNGFRFYVDGCKTIDYWAEGREFCNYDARAYKTYRMTAEKGKEYSLVLELRNQKPHARARLEVHRADPEHTFIHLARSMASRSEAVVLCAGLTQMQEGEGLDREDTLLPLGQAELIRSVVEANPNTLVVLTGGTPIQVRGWVDSVPAVLAAWYPGQEMGSALSDVVFGDVNPCGRLTDTWARNRQDYPDLPNFPTWPEFQPDGDIVDYEEGIYVGYRHFDKNGVEPEYPFGYGLSYTEFAYEAIELTEPDVPGGRISASAVVKNIGRVAGKEVVQLYLRPIDPATDRPIRELKGFRKVLLDPGQSTRVEFTIEPGDFARWDESTGWRVDPGRYAVEIGTSSRDIRLSETVDI